MTAITFPNSPSSGDTHTAGNGIVYTYDGEKWTSIGTNSAGTWTRSGTEVSLTNTGDDLNVDSGTLFVDASTDSVGIGTSSPGKLLALQDSSTPALGFYTGATLRAEINATSAETSILSYANSPITFNIGGSAETEAGRIDSSGNIGIGTSSATNIGGYTGLSINNATNGGFVDLLSNGNEAFRLLTNGFQCNVESRTTIPIVFFTNANERMRIDSAGNVGIGTSSPQAISGYTVLTLNNSSQGGAIEFKNNNTSYGRLLQGSSAVILETKQNIPLIFGTGTSSTERMRIDSSGRLLVGTSSARDVAGSSGYTPRFQVVGNTSEASSILAANEDGSSYIALANLGGGSAVSNSEQLGRINFKGNDGNSYPDFASISAHVDGTPGDGDCPGRLVFSTTADGASSPTERMRVNKEGELYAYSKTNSHTIISRNATSAGNTYGVFIGQHSSTSTTTGATSIIVTTNGNVRNTNNSYGSLSDIKLKENIVDSASQWNDIRDIRVRKYNFKESTNHETFTQLGVIAQEVETVSPGLVLESPDRDNDGNDLGTVTKSVNYSVLYMKAVKALQEAMERIETLEAKVAALEAQ